MGFSRRMWVLVGAAWVLAAAAALLCLVGPSDGPSSSPIVKSGERTRGEPAEVIPALPRPKSAGGKPASPVKGASQSRLEEMVRRTGAAQSKARSRKEKFSITMRCAVPEVFTTLEPSERKHRPDPLSVLTPEQQARVQAMIQTIRTGDHEGGWRIRDEILEELHRTHPEWVPSDTTDEGPIEDVADALLGMYSAETDASFPEITGGRHSIEAANDAKLVRAYLDTLPTDDIVALLQTGAVLPGGQGVGKYDVQHYLWDLNLQGDRPFDLVAFALSASSTQFLMQLARNPAAKEDGRGAMAIDLLKYGRDRTAVPFLLSLLDAASLNRQNAPETEFAERAVDALSELGRRSLLSPGDLEALQTFVVREARVGVSPSPSPPPSPEELAALAESGQIDAAQALIRSGAVATSRSRLLQETVQVLADTVPWDQNSLFVGWLTDAGLRPEIRAAALRRMQPEIAEEHQLILDTATRDPDAKVRLAAVKELMGPYAADRDVLFRIMHSDPDESVRATAARGLEGGLRTRIDLPEAERERLFDSLRDDLRTNSSEGVRLTIIEALLRGAPHPSRYEEDFLGLVRSDPSPRVRWEAESTLLQLKLPADRGKWTEEDRRMWDELEQRKPPQ